MEKWFKKSYFRVEEHLREVGEVDIEEATEEVIEEAGMALTQDPLDAKIATKLGIFPGISLNLEDCDASTSELLDMQQRIARAL